MKVIENDEKIEFENFESKFRPLLDFFNGFYLYPLTAYESGYKLLTKKILILDFPPYVEEFMTTI